MKELQSNDLSFIRAKATNIKGVEVANTACTFIKISIVNDKIKEIIGKIELLQFKTLDFIEISKYLFNTKVGKCSVEQLEPVIEEMLDDKNKGYLEGKYYDAVFLSNIELKEQYRGQNIFKRIVENLPEILSGNDVKTNYLFLVCRMFDGYGHRSMFVSERLCELIEKQEWCEKSLSRGIYSSEKAMRGTF